MPTTITGDDGLIAEQVKSQSKDKHDALRRYIDICKGVRRKFSRTQTAYLDLFCGTGRALVKDTNEWIDGSSVVACKAGMESGAPFTDLYIADADDKRREACTRRLEKMNAPVHQLQGEAIYAAKTYVDSVNPDGLHFALVDPYNLGDLDFRIFKTLLSLKRMDILVHFSLMDFRRNFGMEIEKEESRLDGVAPGWREKVTSSNAHGRGMFFEHWRGLIAGEKAELSPRFKIIKAPGGPELYGLLLVAKHELADKFWSKSTRDPQHELLFPD